MCNSRLIWEILGSPEKFWSLHSWRYSDSDWTWPWETCYSWFCFEQGGWNRWLLEVPSNFRSPVKHRFSGLIFEKPPSISHRNFSSERWKEIIASIIAITWEGTHQKAELLRKQKSEYHIFSLRSRKLYHTGLVS